MTEQTPSNNNEPDEPGLIGPLVISIIDIPGAGQPGLINCPGRHQVNAAQRHWRRVLGEDLTAICAWGAQCVVLLLESHEFAPLGVTDLPARIQASDQRWFHLPIADMQPPGESFTRG
jgi:hypothetical protein